MAGACADVSVIIPAWRAETTIRRALMSVAAQTLPPKAVIVVDDGSPDATRDAAEASRGALGDTTLTVIAQHHAGAGAARNRALAAARTGYVAFLDADDEWLPDKLARSMEVLEETGAVLVAHDSYEVRSGEETRLDCARRFDAARSAPFVGLYRRGFIDTSTVVAERAAVAAAGGFDTSLANAQDFDLWLAMLGRPGTKFTIFDDALSRYHITEGSIMSHIERRRACCMVIARRYAPTLRSHPGCALTSLWYRIAAIHYEAFSAHRAQGDLLAATATMARLGGALIAGTAGFLLGRTPVRRAASA